MTIENDGTAQDRYGIMQHRVAVTFFANYAAKLIDLQMLTMPELAEMIRTENRKVKNKLPWLKLALFGAKVTAKGSLRHDANVERITGIELEHDAGTMTFEEAGDLMWDANIRCLLYTSPSHMIADENGVRREKWRVLVPTWEPLWPDQRAMLAARVNGILKGAATSESFVLSQSFYFGSVDHNPEHKAEVIDGDFIDMRDDLDAGAIGAPPKVKNKKPKNAAASDDATPGYSDEEISRLIDSACELTVAGERQWHPNMLTVTAALVSRLWTDDAIHERCEPAYQNEVVADGGRADVQVMIEGAREKWGIPNPVDDADFMELLREVKQEADAAGVAPMKGSAPGARRVEILCGGLFDEMVDQAARVLIATDTPFFKRGGMLVQPVIRDVQSFHGEPAFAAQLVEVDVSQMRYVLSKKAQFLKFNKTEKKWLAVHPPIDVATALLNRFRNWKFRDLSGLITTQTLRPDGTLLVEPGYDEATQLWLVNPPDMQPIADAPSRADAEQALAVLKDLLQEFPFVVEEGESASLARSVALSAIISTVCRGAYPVVPMHVIDAPAAGTGKSYLLSTVSWIATGQPMAVMSAGKTPEETEKRLGAAVVCGQTLICIDNVEGELGGDALCQLIEQVRPTVRILGQHNQVEIDGRALCLFANGNNITAVGDVYRRMVSCRLDARVDRPEKRQFARDPRALVLADRGKYVAACLTIARAYAAAGRPDKCPQIASFNDWSDTVRSALVWLGEADPVETMDNSRAEDPHVLAHHSLMVEWGKVFGDNRVLLRDVVAKCEETTAGVNFERMGDRAMQYTYSELRAAVVATNPDAHRKGVNLHAFGQRMKAFRDQWLGGMCFVNRKSGPDSVWYLTKGQVRPNLKTKQNQGST